MYYKAVKIVAARGNVLDDELAFVGKAVDDAVALVVALEKGDRVAEEMIVAAYGDARVLTNTLASLLAATAEAVADRFGLPSDADSLGKMLEGVARDGAI